MLLNSKSLRRPLGNLLTQTQSRAFSIVAPQAKLHFIDHPRYGMVYPVVCYNDK